MEGLLINRRKATAYNGPPRDTVSAGDYLSCSNGHRGGSLTRGYDPQRKDYYLEGRCGTCHGTQRIYDKDRHEQS
jgi:hypothetical protein